MNELLALCPEYNISPQASLSGVAVGVIKAEGYYIHPNPNPNPNPSFLYTYNLTSP